MNRDLSSNWGKKAVPPARDGFDEARVVGGIIECRAQLLDGRVEAVVKFDECVGWPEPLADLLPRCQFTPTVQQHREDLEGLVLNFDPQPPLLRVRCSKSASNKPKRAALGLGCERSIPAFS